ncbi:MAG: hypothetical protein IK064_02515, partial [Clostridia bacterium]|nr:hypothetical protein [Clostridia bacterium]
VTAEPTESEAPATAEPTAAPAGPTPEPERTASALFGDVVLPAYVRLNYFAIPDGILALMSFDEIEIYKRLVIAYFAGETEIMIPEGTDEYPNLWRVVDMYFPLFYMDISDLNVTETDGKISWTYTDTGKSHEDNIRAFEDKALSYLSSVVESDTVIMKILTVYRDFTACLNYDDTHLDTNPNIYLYRHGVDAIMLGKGVCWCYARGFNFLIAQVGAETLTVHGKRTTDQATHEWVVFKHHDKWYYCDPTWDMGTADWHSLNYFGFTVTIRNHDRFPDETVFVLKGSKYRASEYFPATDRFFQPLYTGQCYGDTYDLDHERGLILFRDRTYSGGWMTVIAFDTETGEYGDL